MSCNGNHFLSCRIDSVWKMFFYYLLGNSDLSNHAQLICLSMAQTYITIPTYSHYCTDHYTSLHKQTSRFPCDIESNEFQNWLSRPWTSIEFCQNLHQVLKKYGKWFLKMHGNLEISSRNTLSTFIIRPQYNQQCKYQHSAEIRVPTCFSEYLFVKSVNLAKIYIMYWKHMEIVNVVIFYLELYSSLLMTVLQMLYALCFMKKFN